VNEEAPSATARRRRKVYYRAKARCAKLATPLRQTLSPCLGLVILHHDHVDVDVFEGKDTESLEFLAFYIHRKQIHLAEPVLPRPR